MSNETDAVTIEITVNSAAVWEYDYADRTTHHTGKSTGGIKQKHDLGLPPVLHQAIQAWTFRFTNTTSATTGYKIKIEWKQAATVLKTWEKEGDVLTTEPATTGSDAKIK